MYIHSLYLCTKKGQNTKRRLFCRRKKNTRTHRTACIFSERTVQRKNCCHLEPSSCSFFLMLLYGNVSEQHSLKIQHHKQCEDLELEITLLSCSVFLCAFQISLKCVMIREEISPVYTQLFVFLSWRDPAYKHVYA